MSSDEAFNKAVAYVSSSTVSSSTETKLRLYSLFKIATASSKPTGSRPSVFDFQGRAKYDAWLKLGSNAEFDGDEGKQKAKVEYQEEAKKLGWSTESSAEDSKIETGAAEESKKAGKGMVGVSQLVEEATAAEDTSPLHDAAVDGNISRLKELLNDPATDKNARDGFGYTALHLAADRGHANAVKALMEAGVDKSLRDEDGQTALELAQEAGNETIIQLLV